MPKIAETVELSEWHGPMARYKLVLAFAYIGPKTGGGVYRGQNTAKIINVLFGKFHGTFMEKIGLKALGN